MIKKYITLTIFMIMLLLSFNVVKAEIPTAIGSFTSNVESINIGNIFYVTFWVNTNFDTDAITTRQIAWTNHADLLYQEGKAVIFLDPWNTTMTDDGDLQSQGNLTYTMVFDIEGKHSGKTSVFQMKFMAKANGEFKLWVPETIEYGSAEGQPGLDISFADVAYTQTFSLQIGPTGGDGDGDGDGNGGNGDDDDSGPVIPPSNYPPTAILPTEHYNATVNLTITFDGRDSYDDNEIVMYHWYFGDGTNISCNCSTYTHVYTKLGNFTVTLMVKDEDGLSDTATANVWVKPPFIPDIPDDDDDDVEPGDDDDDDDDDTEPTPTDKKDEKGVPEYVYFAIIILGGLVFLTYMFMWRKK